MKVRKWVVDITLYKLVLNVLIGDTVADCCREAEKSAKIKFDWEGRDKGRGLASVMEGDNGTIYRFLMLEVEKRKVDVGSIVHEALHSAIWMLDTVDIPFDKDNHEQLTYLQEYIVIQVIGVIKEDRFLKLKTI